MTPEEAIKELNDLEAGDIELGRDKAAKAERLGIEAIRELQKLRNSGILGAWNLLPGETKE